MKQDRRVNRSQKLIKEAFMQLLKNQTFESVTVQSISETADVNRSTFYAHYYDKFDLLDKLEDEYIEKIKTDVEEAKALHTYTVHDVMRHLIHHLEEDMDFYRQMFLLEKDSDIEEKLYRLLNDHLNSYRRADNTIGGIPFDYFMSYVTGAGIALIKHWIIDENRISSDALINHFYNIVTQGPARIIADEVGESDI